MKRKLKVVLILIALSLTGIIVFQAYWSINAYQVNKKAFDGNIDSAMKQALEKCKKDYFDSIRVVMVRRLSDTDLTEFRVDTIYDTVRGPKYPLDTAKLLSIRVINFNINGKKMGNGPMFRVEKTISLTPGQLDFYRKKINHPATMPELLTETSFYVPEVLDAVLMSFSFQDFSVEWPNLDAYFNTHQNIPRDTIYAHQNQISVFQVGMAKLPPNYRQADSLKISRYFTAELKEMQIYSPFNLDITYGPILSAPPSSYYSETHEYKYTYHGFVFLRKAADNVLYIRATFNNPQYIILKNMIITLISSVLLVLFTIFCFYYIIQTINHQRALGQLKDDFINNMTHELKTPIATITVAIEGLQKYNVLSDPEKTQRYLQTSHNELNRLNELVSKVLDVAAFESREIRLTKESITIDDLVNELIIAQKSKADKQVNITYTNKDGITNIEADRLHFKNVLLNILDNAVKYAHESVDIKITLYKNFDMALFSIKDNGIGIPQAHINRVFEKFHRVPTGNVHNVKGTGLGLSYVKHIIEAHGGAVHVSSEVGKGSEFIISIPVQNG